jgi:hypothetical protein
VAGGSCIYDTSSNFRLVGLAVDLVVKVLICHPFHHHSTSYSIYFFYSKL